MVYLYRFTNGSGWKLLRNLSRPGVSNSGDHFGAAVAFDGEWLLVGAPDVSGAIGSKVGGEVWAYDLSDPDVASYPVHELLLMPGDPDPGLRDPVFRDLRSSVI